MMKHVPAENTHLFCENDLAYSFKSGVESLDVPE